ncbi:hypothetical protein ACHAXA_005423 [Cyclostephanos tholiformis]|uniref:Uncharacterized protein n=1 Tax=Cyclostephanos tholiformis TaxID=382380 RepID=A0ABD3RFS3_9STRA
MDEAIDHYKVVLLGEGEEESDDRSASVPSSPCTYRQPARPFSMVPSSAGRVGKTSILLRCVGNTYDASCPSTLLTGISSRGARHHRGRN